MSQLHRLFSAVRPNTQAQDDISAVVSNLSGQCGRISRLVTGERQHVTLHFLGDHPDAVLPELLRQARMAGSSVDAEPFAVMFDRIGGMKEGGDLTVLSSSRGTAELRQFQRTVAEAMSQNGIAEFVRSRFNPHLSLIYAERAVQQQAITPISWTVDELVLIDSLVGRGFHNVVGCWPLQIRQSGLDW